MNGWQLRNVPFKFQLSDWTILSLSKQLQMRSVRLLDPIAPQDLATFPLSELPEKVEGCAIRGMPIDQALPQITRLEGYIRYVTLQYMHCYIDLGMSFDEYQKKFSSKTRSTVKRKLNKYAEHSAGTIKWKSYRRPDDVEEFFRHAREVSKLTYQERLLDVGLPTSDAFVHDAKQLAEDGRLRAYLLFDGERPVSYLYCPVHDGVAIYAYLGYDPEYMRMSVGTVLQWLALEEMFNERTLRYFDFTEGQSDHKRLFATHQRRCANVFFLRDTLVNKGLVHAHSSMNWLSAWLGEQLDRFGLKARIRRLLRFSS